VARKLRVLFKGAIYHVTTRGIERRRLFDDDTDGAAVLQQIQRLRQRMVEDAELRRRVEQLSSKLERREKSAQRGKMSNIKG
jgi:hypothetical protein